MKASKSGEAILGGETVITSILPTPGGFYLTGSRKEGHYKTLAMKLNPSFEVEWERTFGDGTSDFEGHGAALSGDGIMVCGCSGGHATTSGGKGWKAYMVQLSGAGEKARERAYRILGNDCAYSVISGESTILFGEAKSDEGRCQIFLQSLDEDGSLLWVKQYGDYDGIMAGGVIPTVGGFIMVCSVKVNDVWHLLTLGTDATGETVWERMLGGCFILQICGTRDRILVTGERSGNIYLAELDHFGSLVWERELDRGIGISVVSLDDEIFLGGESCEDGSKVPVIYRMDRKGILIGKMTLGGEGWVETMAISRGELIAVRHGTAPNEHSGLNRIILQND